MPEDKDYEDAMSLLNPEQRALLEGTINKLATSLGRPPTVYEKIFVFDTTMLLLGCMRAAPALVLGCQIVISSAIAMMRNQPLSAITAQDVPDTLTFLS